MDKYQVNLNAKAYRDLDAIFAYIAIEKMSPHNAKAQTDRIKDALSSLAFFPFAHQEREEGSFANKGYRQLLIDNYMAIYRIDETRKQVHVVTIQYQGRDF